MGRRFKKCHELERHAVAVLEAKPISEMRGRYDLAPMLSGAAVSITDEHSYVLWVRPPKQISVNFGVQENSVHPRVKAELATSTGGLDQVTEKLQRFKVCGNENWHIRAEIQSSGLNRNAFRGTPREEHGMQAIASGPRSADDSADIRAQRKTPGALFDNLNARETLSSSLK